MKTQAQTSTKVSRYLLPAPLSKKISSSGLSNRVHNAKFLSKRDIGSQTYEFSFLVEGKFSFQPGQYVWLSLKHLKKSDERGNRRAMSIVNIDAGDNIVSLIFRSSRTSFKKAAMNLKRNDEVDIIGPNGSSFLLPKDSSKPIVFIAGGTGIAPFMSLSRSELKNRSKRKIKLIYTDERGAQAAYYKELQNLNSPNLKYLFSEKPIKGASLKNIDDLADSEIYVCGTQGFVDYYYNLLVKFGIKERQMHFENYYPSSDVDQLMREVFIDFTKDDLKSIKNIDQATLRQNILLSAIESSANHTIITDTNGRIVLANNAAEDITGFKFSEMRLQTPRLWGGFMPDDFYQKLWKSKLNGNKINEEIVNRRKDGSLYIVVSHIAPITNKAGTILGFIATEEDITNVREQENRAKTTSSLFESTLLGIAEILIITDEKGKISRLNKQAQEILGCGEQSAMGARLVDVLVMTDKNGKIIPDQDRPINKVLADKKPIVSDGIFSDIYIRRKDSSLVPIYVAVSPIFSDGKLVATVQIIRDISRDKEVDIAKSEFVSLASHQLRTPLSSINWYSEMLLSGDAGKLNKQQHKYMTEVDIANSRMVKLINSLLNVSRLELGTFTLEPEKINPKDCAEEVIKEITTKTKEKKQRLSVVFQSNTDDIIFDKQYLEMIYQNLLSNAVKYTPDKGKIELIVSSIKSGKEVDGYKIPANGIIISVSDNGYGVPKSQQDKIMTKLFRADNAQEKDPDGTGLGLYIIKSVIDHSKGNLWFKSAENKGTTFHAYLPLETKKKEGTKKLD